MDSCVISLSNNLAISGTNFAIADAFQGVSLHSFVLQSRGVGTTAILLLRYYFGQIPIV